MIYSNSEEWRAIRCPPFSELYEVSNFGNFRSLDRYVTTKKGARYLRRGALMKLNKNSSGYNVVTLSKDGKSRSVSVRRMVMLAFSPHEQEDELHVNHINSIRDDNRLENLEWCTQKENIIHGVEFGHIAVGSDNYNSKRMTVKNIEGDIVSIIGSVQEATDILDISRGSLDRILNSNGEIKLFDYFTLERSDMEVSDIPIDLLDKKLDVKRNIVQKRSVPVKIHGHGFTSYYEGIRHANRVNKGCDFFKNLKLGRLIRGLYKIEHVSQWEYVSAEDDLVAVALPVDTNGNIIIGGI